MKFEKGNLYKIIMEGVFVLQGQTLNLPTGMILMFIKMKKDRSLTKSFFNDTEELIFVGPQGKLYSFSAPAWSLTAFFEEIKTNEI